MGTGGGIISSEMCGEGPERDINMIGSCLMEAPMTVTERLEDGVEKLKKTKEGVVNSLGNVIRYQHAHLF